MKKFCLLPTDADGNQLIPGCLYCMGETNPDDEDFPIIGGLAWYAYDGEFYCADYDVEAEKVTWPYDFAVLQIGSFNQEYA